MIERQRAFFRTRRTFSLSFRLKQLDVLRRAVAEREEDLYAALDEDLGKSRLEAYTSETGFVLSDIDHAARNLRFWMRPERRSTPLIARPGKSRVVPRPYGTILITGPWNYPFQLLFSPLTGAIAAGNCVCLKPSEYAPAVSRLIGELIGENFAPEYINVVEGDAETARNLLEQRFDYIFFTGSSRVGKEVMVSAARHLTPVTLELGGKCPCIVCEDADLGVTARRIMRGKLLNAGQTCVAPDYVLADESVFEALLAELENACRSYEGRVSGRIINRAHFDRIAAYLKQGRILCGGETDPGKLRISPSILVDVDFESPVMQEEIFGPVLPVLRFKTLEDVFKQLDNRPSPLALYVFSGKRSAAREIIDRTSSGGVCINDTVTHIMGKHLPLGGVGESGMGSYRGRATYDTFTHYRSVLERGTWIDFPFGYPEKTVSQGFIKRIYGFLMG